MRVEEYSSNIPWIFATSLRRDSLGSDTIRSSRQLDCGCRGEEARALGANNSLTRSPGDISKALRTLQPTRKVRVLYTAPAPHE